MKIKKGDTVVVIAGKDQGVKGKVIAAYPRQRQGPRRGRQPVKKHTKVTQPRSAAPRPAASSRRRPRSTSATCRSSTRTASRPASATGIDEERPASVRVAALHR